jgi:phosphoglycerate dehydrogenase-like enzyme
MTLLLALRRRVPEIVRAQERAHWLSPPPFAGSLVGEHILVLGAGEVAREFQRRAEAFAASVALVGRTARPGVYPVAELPDLLPRYGVVVVAVSANSSTRHLVNAEFLAAMPDGASLVNVARGWVVDTEALIAELTAGRLTAALDVTDPEPLGADHPLWRTPGVLIAPHTAAATSGVADRAVGVAVAQLRQFAQGRIPDNAVPRSDLA